MCYDHDLISKPYILQGYTTQYHSFSSMHGIVPVYTMIADIDKYMVKMHKRLQIPVVMVLEPI